MCDPPATCSAHWRRHRFCRIVVVVVGLASVISSAAGATQPAVVIDSVDLGIEGGYKIGHWVPIGVTIQAGDERYQGTFVAEVRDSNGVPAQFVGGTVDLPPNVASRLSTYVKFGQTDGDLVVRLTSNGGEATQHRFTASQLPTALRSDQKLVISLGGDLEIDAAQTIRQAQGSEDLVHHHVTLPDRLPQYWLGYSSVDAIVLTTSDAALLESLSPTQWGAFRRWVELGGTVVCSGASQMEEFFGTDSTLGWLAPGTIEGQHGQRQTSGIEQFTEAVRRLDQIGATAAAFSLPMATVSRPRGQIEASEGFGTQQFAAVIHYSVGLGRSIFVAFDLDQPPFLGWSDRSRLVAKLLDVALEDDGPDDTARTGLGPVAHFGYSDLIGQLRHALDQFRGVRLVPFSWIAGMVALYIAIVGPVDYWILTRWRRTEWTWITFLVSVLLFTGLAFALAVRWKGTDLRSNQVNLVDIDLNEGTVRGRTWNHLFSPRTCQVSLLADPQIDLNWIEPWRSVVSWQGLPGDGFGGLDRRQHSTSFREPFQVVIRADGEPGPMGHLEHFPIAVWSSQSLLGQWWGRTQLDSAATRLLLQSDRSLSGSISNPFSFDLIDGYLVFDRWAIRLGEFKAGQTRRLTRDTGIDLQTLLSQRKVVKGRNAVTPWDENAIDVDRIMQLLLFYGAAKGRAYTRLRHAYQREIDWSSHLATGQAVLWGRSSVPLGQVLVDGQQVQAADDWSYVRLMIPVEQPTEN